MQDRFRCLGRWRASALRLGAAADWTEIGGRIGRARRSGKAAGARRRPGVSRNRRVVALLLELLELLELLDLLLLLLLLLERNDRLRLRLNLLLLLLIKIK